MLISTILDIYIIIMNSFKIDLRYVFFHGEVISRRHRRNGVLEYLRRLLSMTYIL